MSYAAYPLDLMEGGVFRSGRIRRARAGWSVCLHLGAAVFLFAVEVGRASAGAGLAQEIQFDIGALPLHEAIDMFSAASGKDVFYDGASGWGLRASPVKGFFTADAALEKLLADTEFVIRRHGSDGYTLLLLGRTGLPPALQERMQADKAFQGYFAVVQGRVQEAFCARRHLLKAQGAGHVLIALWIGGGGLVMKADVSPQGEVSPETQRLLTDVFRSMSFGAPPPVSMPQPVTMAIFPQAAVEACAVKGVQPRGEEAS